MTHDEVVQSILALYPGVEFAYGGDGSTLDPIVDDDGNVIAIGLEWHGTDPAPTLADLEAAWPDQVTAAQNAQPATAADHRTASAQIIDEKLASVPVSRGELPTILQNLLGEAVAAIPFFEKYALDPSMTAAQWEEFQTLPQHAKNPQTDSWTGDGTATSWALTGNLDQTLPFTLTVAAATATVAVAASPAGATTQYVLVAGATAGTWSLECGTDPAPATGVALSLAYTKIETISKERLQYDALRSLTALIRYLTGLLPTA